MAGQFDLVSPMAFARRRFARSIISGVGSGPFAIALMLAGLNA